MSLLFRIHELATAAATGSLTGITTRLMAVVIGISAVVIALLWIPIAFSFFSADEQKRYMAYSRARNAAIGTLIFVLAVSGTLYALFHYIAVG